MYLIEIWKVLDQILSAKSLKHYICTPETIYVRINRKVIFIGVLTVIISKTIIIQTK